MHERSALPLDDKAVGISQMPLRASFRVADDSLEAGERSGPSPARAGAPLRGLQDLKAFND
jgi:hypothetical protein